MKRRRESGKFKPCIPAVITGNIRSLANKCSPGRRGSTESLVSCVSLKRYTSRYRIPMPIPGFYTVWAHRDTTLSGKKKRGGLTVLVNNRWCHLGHSSKKECLCSPDTELLHLYYLPREFTSHHQDCLHSAIWERWSCAWRHPRCDCGTSDETPRSIHHLPRWLQSRLSLIHTPNVLPVCQMHNKGK